jgi:hypothetical protein
MRLLLLVLAIVSFSKVALSADYQNLELSLTRECQSFIKNLGLDYNYGWVKVPEDWSRASSTQMIHIFYYSNWKPGKVPVVHFNGGPLSSSHGVHASFEEWAQPRRLGFIFFDQRGTGCSTPLSFNSNFSTLVKSSYYDSLSIAKDAEVIRKQTIGNRKWKIFGQSQGGLMAQRYLSLFPNKTLSTHVFGTLNVENFRDFYFVRMLAQHKILQKVELDFPGTIARIKKAKSSLDKNDCLMFFERKVCGSSLLQPLYLFLDGSSVEIKRIVDLIISPSGQVNLEKLKDNFEFVFEYFYSAQFHAAQSILRQELSSVQNLMILIWDCELAYRSLAKFGITKNELIIDECSLINAVIDRKMAELYSNSFPRIPVRERFSLKRVINTLELFPDQRLYIYSSGMDPMAGSVSHFSFAKESRQIVHRHFPNLGHNGYIVNAKLWDDLAAD